MPETGSDIFELLIRKLHALEALSAFDEAAIRSLSFTTRSVNPGDTLVREGDAVTECCLLLSGYACRHKQSGDGGRQIVSFHVAGDLLDVQHLLLSTADHNVQVISNAEIACLPKRELQDLIGRHPNVAKALWKDSLIEASIFREWVLNVGRRGGAMRVAHMLCEFAVRREAAGLGSPERFDLPMTQEDIGDAVGLTTIHVNRMLRALTEDGAITRDGRSISITNWDRMKQIADFNPLYLHMAA